MRLSRPVHFLIPYLLLNFGYALESQQITYQNSLEGAKTTWTIDNAQDKIKISGQNKGSDIELEYSPSFSLLHYFEQEPNAKPLDIKIEGNKLSVKNKNTSKNLSLGKLPWVQDFKFGFHPFLNGVNKEFSFSIVYAKDLSLHDMIATKEGEETIEINGKKHLTQKVKVTLKGFKKRFWKAELWFDKVTHLMLKYSSNEGPGTDHVTVTLIPTK